MPSLQDRIATDLRQAITSGEHAPGTKLPTEQALMTRYGVSRNTVRGATEELVNEGLITKHPGRGGGMYVRDHVILTYHASSAELAEGRYSESDAYFSSVREQGFEPSQDFSVAIETASADISRRLQIPEGSPVAVRTCLRYVNGKPSSTQVTYYPEWLTELVPALLSPHDIPQGTTRYLAEHGYQQVAFNDEIGARMPNPQHASMLDISAGTPILVYTRTGWTQERPVRVTTCVFPADRNLIFYSLGDTSVMHDGEPR